MDYVILPYAERNKQWGYVQISEDKLYPLPIAFTKAYSATANQDTNGGDVVNVSCSALSKIKLICEKEHYKHFIAVGW